MSSSLKWGLLFVSAISLTVLSGCGDYLTGAKHKPETIELNNSKLQCLEKLPQQIRDFSEGVSVEKDIGQGITCLQDGLTYFKERTLGSVENGYTAQDMRSFFGKYFLKENNVSPELASDLMRLKQALLGGSDRFITKSEIDRLVELLSDFRREVLLVRPHVKNLTLRQAKFESSQFDESLRVFRGSLHRLFGKTELVRSGYSFSEAKSLFSGIADFVTGDQPFALYVQASEMVPLIEAIKIVLLGEDSRLITVGDWIKAVDSFVDLYDLLLKSSYQLKVSSLSSAAKLQVYVDMAKSTLDLLEKSPRMQRESYISLVDIDRLVSEINQREWLPVAVSDRSIKETYRVILARMLDSERHGDTRALYGLQIKHLRSLRTEFNSFALIQNFIDQQLTTKALKLSELRVAIKNYSLDSQSQKLASSDVLEQKHLKSAWEFYALLMSKSQPMHFDGDGRATLRYVNENLKYDWSGMTRFNVMMTLSRMLLVGYADGGGPFQTLSMLKDDKRGINGLAQWYQEFDSLGLELKAFDPRSKNSGDRSFLEASLFTPSGDGDNRLNASETFEFISMLISGGLGTSSMIQKSLDQQNCQISGKRDVFDFPMYSETCFRRVLRSEFHKYFENLPAMAGWGRMLNNREWNEFVDNLLLVARVSDPKGGAVEMADIRTGVMILHYTESLFTTYDRDGSQDLDSNEIRDASNRFLGFLRNLSPGTSDSNLSTGFAYLVLNGEQPSAFDVIQFMIEDSIVDTGRAHRGQVLRVFRSLKESTLPK